MTKMVVIGYRQPMGGPGVLGRYKQGAKHDTVWAVGVKWVSVSFLLSHLTTPLSSHHTTYLCVVLLLS